MEQIRLQKLIKGARGASTAFQKLGEIATTATDGIRNLYAVIEAAQQDAIDRMRKGRQAQAARVRAEKEARRQRDEWLASLWKVMTPVEREAYLGVNGGRAKSAEPVTGDEIARSDHHAGPDPVVDTAR